LVFDLETTALDPEDGRIFMIGVKDNRGYEKVIEVKDTPESEIEAIYEFFDIIDEIKPSIIGGYNSSNFDWPWLFKRAEILGMNTKEFKTLNPNEDYKMKDGVLKLGAEIEDYKQLKIWGYNSLDIAHSVRRAQTINSEIKSWGLKYITQFSKSEKPNRVYVPGDKIASTYSENKEFYLNIENGKYKSIDEPGLKNLDKRHPKSI
jgi:DNA polymerase I